ncbi:MAG: hypothetical protein HZC48_01860 [Nitrospirae bacterium]|nr:hypothetical protein [Nitrospirota bacterium]
MIKDSKIMADLHGIRERFYEKTKKLSHSELLKVIKEQSQKVEKELSAAKPDSELVVRKKYKVPEPEAMREIHQIREQRVKYGKD